MLGEMKQTGWLRVRLSYEVAESRLGIGMEKLDRDAFDPNPLYDRVAALGVKWIRIQSGWAKTEKAPGAYDFGWLDDIVDNLCRRALKPWMCLCYGNSLYTPEAANYVGAAGFPPLDGAAAEAWDKYVFATVSRYRGRVQDYEIWNEPDGKWCWQHGVNAKEYGQFACRTARAIRSADPQAHVFVGSVFTRDLKFVDDMLATGLYEYADALTFHEYTYDERYILHRIQATRALLDSYRPDIDIIQGESGSQSQSGGFGALNWIETDQTKQAKQLLRHGVADLLGGVTFSSYFSCVDMVECLGGRVDGDCLNNWGYFGLISYRPEREKLDERYTVKPSYRTMQVLAAALGQCETVSAPLLLTPDKSPAVDGMDLNDATLITGAFRNPAGRLGVVYWNSTDMLKIRAFESTLSMQLVTKEEKPCLIDLIDGAVYEFKPLQYRKEDNTCFFTHIPVKDHPLLIAFEGFADIEQTPPKR